MPDRRRLRRRITYLIAGVAVVAAGAGAWFGRDALADAPATIEGWSTRLRDIAADAPQRELDDRAGSSAPGGILVVVGDGLETTFAIVSVSEDAPPALTIVPASLQLLLPGFGEFSLAESVEFEGPELATLALENALGIRFDDVLHLHSGVLPEALHPGVRMDVPVALFADEGGVATRVVPEGTDVLTPEQMERLLLDPGSGTVFEWVQRQGAVWRAVFGRMRSDPSLADSLTAAMPARNREAADLLLALAADSESRYETLPVVDAATAGRPLAVAVGDTTPQFVAQRLANLLMADQERPRVEILNGNGHIGTTRVVAGVLIRQGFLVVVTDNADRFDYESTQVVAQSRSNEEYGRRVVEALGTGGLFIEVQDPSQTVDVSIIVGLDVPTGG
ncbi:LytR C-terminal domain-containing protein [bacterium]|nr:LytR C-terminal domain-containing protein [bacterium]